MWLGRIGVSHLELLLLLLVPEELLQEIDFCRVKMVVFVRDPIDVAFVESAAARHN